MKKFLSLLLCFLMAGTACTALFGCTRGGDSGKLIVTILNQESEVNMFTKVAEAFCAENPGVVVELMPLGNYETEVLYKLHSGEPIDVLHVPDNYVTPFQKDGVLENLEPYIEQSGFDRSLYFDSMMNMGKLYFDPAEDQYMIPRDYSKFVVYYNKTLFDECEVEYPKSGWTWEDFKETCRLLSLKLPEKYYCVDASMTYAILNYGIMASCGVETYVDEEFNAPADTAAMENALKMIKSDLIDPGYVIKPELYQAGDFVKQVAAMNIGVRPAFESFKTAGIDFDVVEFPAIGENPKVATGSSGFCISSGSSNKDLAWKFISFVVSEAGQKILSESGNTVPVLKSLAEAEDAEWRQVTNGKDKAIDNEPFFSLSERDVVGAYWGKLPANAITSYNTFWANCMGDYLNGKKDLSMCLSNYANAITAYKRMYPEYFK